MNVLKKFDVVVVGAGHAGCEAALAAARMGARTAIVAADRSAIARMSCNPSIGGIAKSHMVFELDALGGEMAINTDYTGIQFRVLNTSKGPAVRANRAQCDKDAYPARMQAVIAAQENLTVIDGLVTDLWIENASLRGVTIGTEQIAGRTVVITAGTFLRGVIHIGTEQIAGGRMGEAAAKDLSASLEGLGLALARLKTGTPPRIARQSVDFTKMALQPGEMPAPFFSWKARRDREMFHVEQSGAASGGDANVPRGTLDPLRPWAPGEDPVPCHLTHTTSETHQLIEDNLSASAMYAGAISGTGVRYCPSIEDKIVKFADKAQHHIFIEPEGRHNDLIYPNGISNSLPREVQERMVRTIPGLEEAQLVQYGYAIEYDYSDPTQLRHTLECKKLEGLFMAGQVNGTTGYEEAGAQGFVAGVNAALKALDEGEFVLPRQESYIGVLVDDLVTKGTDEPYRMFTSRAEHRLLLRQDNARFRMLRYAERLGIQSEDWCRETRAFEERIASERERLRTSTHEGIALDQLLRRPEVSIEDLPEPPVALHKEVAEQIEIQVKYHGYIQRELNRIRKQADHETVEIPAGLDYWKIRALRYETQEKLSRVLPSTLGQASRVPGISPADVAILSVIIKDHGDPRR